MKKINDLLGEKIGRYKDILDSVMPGGNNWERYINHGNCLEACPYYDKCTGYGPSKKLCSDSWAQTPARPEAIQVIGHIFKNYSFYDRDDYRGDIGERVAELCTIFDTGEFEELSPSEAQRMVTVRIAQAEFKTNLFNIWKGCSLENIAVADEYLIASHIKPWSKCNTRYERVDGNNGFLLPPNYDYVFDKFLITFSNDGEIRFINSAKLHDLYSSLGINKSARIQLRKENYQYLEYHQKVFEEKASILSEN